MMNGKLILWGSGEVGKRFFKYLAKIGKDELVDCFCNSEPNRSIEFYGVKIQNYRETLGKNCVYILTVSNKFRKEIVELIESLGEKYYCLSDSVVSELLEYDSQSKRNLRIKSLLGDEGDFVYRVSLALHRTCYIEAIRTEIKLMLSGVPLFLRTYSRDLDFFESIFVGSNGDGNIRGEYDFEYPRYDGVLDLGANIGLFSRFLLMLNRNISIIAVEPEENNFKQLEKNLRYYDNVKLVKGGVWYKNCFCRVCPGRVVVETTNRISEGSFYIDECNSFEKNAIECFDIDTLTSRIHTDSILIKMDIEGSEKRIFENTSSDSLWIRKCVCLAIETHEWLLNDNSDILIAERMGTFGYTYEINGENKIWIKRKND